MGDIYADGDKKVHPKKIFAIISKFRCLKLPLSCVLCTKNIKWKSYRELISLVSAHPHASTPKLL